MHTYPRRKSLKDAFKRGTFVSALSERMLHEFHCHTMRSVPMSVITPQIAGRVRTNRRYGLRHVDKDAYITNSMDKLMGRCNVGALPQG